MELGMGCKFGFLDPVVVGELPSYAYMALGVYAGVAGNNIVD
jgi:hypothetical protein